MICFAFLLLIFFSTKSQFWEYRTNEENYNWDGMYGTDFADENHPGGRNTHATAKYKDSMFLFGGEHYWANISDYPTVVDYYRLADMWQFNYTLNQWRWIDTIGDGTTQKLPITTSSVGSTFSSSYYPNSRYLHRLVTDVTNSIVYLHGGRGLIGTHADIWAFSINLQQWRLCDHSGDATSAIPTRAPNITTVNSFDPSNNPGYRRLHAAVFHGNSYYTFGGVTYGGVYKADMWEFNTVSQQWKYHEADSAQQGGDHYGEYFTDPKYPGARHSSMIWVYKDGGNQDVIYTMGGVGFDRTSNGYLRDVWYFQINEADPTLKWVYTYIDPWTQSVTDEHEGVFAVDMHDSGLLFPGCRIFNQYAQDEDNPQYIYLLGGFGYAESTFGTLGDFWLFDTEAFEFFNKNTDEMQRLASCYSGFDFGNMYPSARRYGSLNYHGGKIHLYGGYIINTYIEPQREEWFYHIEGSCFGIYYNDSTVCSSQGKCVGMDQCLCNKQRGGNQCQYHSCYGKSGGNHEVCSYNGICIGYDSCWCYIGFTGNACEVNVFYSFMLLFLSNWYIFLILFLLLVIIIALIVVLYFVVRYCKKVKKYEKYEDEINMFISEKKAQSKVGSKSKSYSNTRSSSITGSLTGGKSGMANLKQINQTINYDDIKLIKELGSGGSDTMIYYARWKKNFVAVKVFKTLKISKEKILQFEKEIEVLSQLSHPNLVTFYGFAAKASRISIVMEYCESGDLKVYFETETENGSPVKMLPKVKMLEGIAIGMNYLHTDKKIIHRDLKPKNILLSNDLTPKICDFGLSKMVDSNELAEQTRRVGSSFFMAPEIAMGKPYNYKCDVFSFGIIVFCVLENNFSPYGRKTIPSLEMKVANDRNFRPKLTKKCPQWLVELMNKSWDHDSSKRLSFKEILELITDNKPQRASRSSRLPRFFRKSRKNNKLPKFPPDRPRRGSRPSIKKDSPNRPRRGSRPSIKDSKKVSKFRNNPRHSKFRPTNPRHSRFGPPEVPKKKPKPNSRKSKWIQQI